MITINKALPKWPALIVVGETVTKEQAMEICIRTDRFSFCSNDRDFEKMIHKHIYGVDANWSELSDSLTKKHNFKNWNDVYDFENNVKKQYKNVELEYLNNSRILSSWIGGSHGWCDWNGNIGCNNYNIGKYPSVEEVYKEWKIIAKEFPFLKLKSQLLSGETYEENTEPVVQFNISNGKVKVSEPKKLLNSPIFNNVYNNLFEFGRERGCTIIQFIEACEYVKHKYE